MYGRWRRVPTKRNGWKDQQRVLGGGRGQPHLLGQKNEDDTIKMRDLITLTTTTITILTIGIETAKDDTI